MKNTLTGTVTAGNREKCLDLACDIAAEYFGHGNVEVTITSAELRGIHTLDGEFQSARFEADFTAEEVTP